MLTFAIATAGMTVFAPSPVKPDSRPLTSKVGRAARSSVVYPVSPKLRRAEILAVFLLVERQRFPGRPFVVSTAAGRGVEPGDLDASAAVLHLRQDLGQHHRRIRDGAAEDPRVEIRLRPSHVDLKVDETTRASSRSTARHGRTSPSPKSPTSAEQGLVRTDEIVEMRRSDFLLAFDQQLDVDRQGLPS